MTNKSPRPGVGSLFSGVGGFDLGLERAGMSISWQSEIDPYASAVLQKHWPGTPNLGDIKEIINAPTVDILCGGFPCQPHSVAGKQRGKEDERHLWPEYMRLVRAIRPRWVLAENVPGIRTTAADEVLGDLEAEDYAVWPLVVGLYAFGAQHERMRIVFVALDKRTELWEQPRRLCRARGEGPAEPKDLGTARHDAAHDQISGRPSEGQRRTESEFAGVGCVGESWIAERTEWGRSEPPVVRRLHGIPPRLVRARRRERIKCLGNSFSPIHAEALGRMIMRFENLPAPGLLLTEAHATPLAW